MKIEGSVQLFCCEFCESSQNKYYAEQLWVAAAER